MMPTIENITDLRDILAVPDLHLEAIYGQGAEVLYQVCGRSAGASPTHRVSEELIQEALKCGLLLESLDYCSCFNLAEVLHVRIDSADMLGLSELAERVGERPGGGTPVENLLRQVAHLLSLGCQRPDSGEGAWVAQLRRLLEPESSTAS